MGTPGKRLAQLIGSQEKSVSDFSKKIGIGQSAVSEMISGKRPIGGNTAVKLAEYFKDLSLDWLLLGRGQMTSQKSEVNEPATDYVVQDQFEITLQKYIERPGIQKRIEKIVDDRIVQLQVKWEFGDKDSELSAKLSDIIKRTRDNGAQ